MGRSGRAGREDLRGLGGLEGAVMGGVLVIGYGNELRGDDGVGPCVARTVASWQRPGLRALAGTAERGMKEALRHLADLANRQGAESAKTEGNDEQGTGNRE